MKETQSLPFIFPRKFDYQLQPYTVGGLLYTPASHVHIASRLLERRIPYLQSLALCLEDAIDDSAVEASEATLIQTFETLHRAIDADTFALDELPFLFVRVRTADQFMRIASHPICRPLLTGFILPKFSCHNMQSYFAALADANALAFPPVRIMPTLESADIASIFTRQETLAAIRQALEPFRETVLNIRVGGNDFCNLFHVRRHLNETIYAIMPVRDILSDILNVFSGDFVVSGPVWEYFSTDRADTQWKNGLLHEIALDQLNGFIGKTAIHPTQLLTIRQAMRVQESDHRDAQTILCWQDEQLGVGKSVGGNRMNERKVHQNWANKTQNLAAVYGVCEEEEEENPAHDA